ncbi:hypothetical protein [Sphingomonas sp.]
MTFDELEPILRTVAPYRLLILPVTVLLLIVAVFGIVKFVRR